MIIFKKKTLKAKLRNPLLNFAIDEQEIELRRDPLTKKWCRININRVKRAHPGLAEDGKATKAVVERSKKGCPFCQDNVFKATPKFVNIKERMILNESVLFPNLYPFSVFHAVVVLSSKKHFIDLNDLSSKLLFDSLRNSIEFFKIARRKEPSFKYPSISLNFMPPAAASVVHPHFQIILDDKPTFFTDLLIKNSLAYYKKYKSSFWLSLIKTEKKSRERFIGETGSFSWVTDFAPFRNNQVSGILTEKVSSVTDLSKKQIKDLSNGLSKIFKMFWRKNVRSVNMSIFSSAIDKNIGSYFPVNLKIVSRPTLTQSYVSDIGFMELMNEEPVVETLPEEVAKSLRFA
ncbi:MAG: hypothetical protein QMD12_00180 [Candidatus Aenigmarchaeota archaeon]|nr:hypothetical protein [Candidatus Aenigmarchaeota archaeon]